MDDYILLDFLVLFIVVAVLIFLDDSARGK